MAKYKVLQKFRDVETKEVYEADDEIEMTVKRADEAVKNLAKYDGEFLERIDNKGNGGTGAGGENGQQGQEQGAGE